jgi:UDP-glucose 4-epimerase
VGTAVGTSLRELVEVTRRLFGIEAQPVWGSMPAREWDTDVWLADNTLIGKALGWRPRYDVEAGLSRTLDWFRGCPSLVERYSATNRS